MEGVSRPSHPPRRGPRVDPVLAETVAAVAWLTVGTLGLGADGVGTLVLAIGIAAAVFVVVERRRNPRTFDAARSALLLRLAGGVVVVVIVGSILLGLVSSTVFLPGIAAVATGVALLSLFRATGERPTQWLGVAAVVLGVLSAFVSTQTDGGFASQGLLGLVLGIALLLSAADRIGMLNLLRDRAR